jgi:uncharacterized protein (TIGR00369 family)
LIGKGFIVNPLPHPHPSPHPSPLPEGEGTLVLNREIKIVNHFLDKGKEVLESQPFSCLMGAELTSLSQGNAELALQIRESFKQSYGYVHGGVVSYLADNCLTFAGATLLGNCVTSEFKINYVLPAIGEKLIAKSTVLSCSLRQAVCECRVYALGDSEEAVLIAVALGTIVKIQV